MKIIPAEDSPTNGLAIGCRIRWRRYEDAVYSRLEGHGANSLHPWRSAAVNPQLGARTVAELVGVLKRDKGAAEAPNDMGQPGTG